MTTGPPYSAPLTHTPLRVPQRQWVHENELRDAAENGNDDRSDTRFLRSGLVGCPYPRWRLKRRAGLLLRLRRCTRLQDVHAYVRTR